MSDLDTSPHTAIQDFTAKTTDDYFIAIAKQDVHSFIMVGVIYNGQPKLLARVGKVGCPCGCAATSACKHCQAHLYDEGIYRKDNACVDISYSAHAISFQQLLDFIALMETISALQKENMIAMHKPKSLPQKQDKMVKFTYTSEMITPNVAPKNSQNVCKKSQQLNPINTCRHTAIDILNHTRGAPTPAGISSAYFFDLPIETQLVAGKPSVNLPFYVLPPPQIPTSNTSHDSLLLKKQHVLKQLYQRLESLVRLNPYSSHTVKKFNWVKSLYLTTAKTPFQSLSALKQFLMLREEAADPAIFTLRQAYFFDRFFKRSCATKQLMTDLKHSLQ